MFFKSFLYSTLLCSVAIGAEPFDPNNLTGKACDQRRQLIEYLDQNGVEHIKSDSLTILKFLATSYINSQASNGDTQVLRDQLDTLAEEKDRLQTKADRRKQKKQAIAAEKLSLEQNLSVITAQLQAAEADLSALRSQKNQSTQALEHKITTLTEERDRLQTKADTRKQKKKAIAAEKLSLEQHLSVIRPQLQAAEENLTALQSQKNQLTQALEHKITTLTEERDRLKDEVDSLKEKVLGDQQLEEIVSRFTTYEKQISDLRADLEHRQELSEKLEDSYRETLNSKAQELSDLEQRHQGDLLLIAQLQERIRLLEVRNKTNVSTSESSAPPPPPPAPPSTPPKASQPSKRVPTPMPKPSKKSRDKFDSKSDQTHSADGSKPEELLKGIRGYKRTDEQKIKQIKGEIESGIFKSAFWSPDRHENAKDPQNTSLTMADILLKAMTSRRSALDESIVDQGNNDDGWLDEDQTSAAASSADTKQIPNQLLRNLSTIRQIYRDALGIGYEDQDKQKKWSTDQWLLWESENYKTEEQKKSIDEAIKRYIEENIDSLSTKYANIDFNTVTHQDGTPVALHKPLDESQDPLAQSVVMK